MRQGIGSRREKGSEGEEYTDMIPLSSSSVLRPTADLVSALDCSYDGCYKKGRGGKRVGEIQN